MTEEAKREALGLIKNCTDIFEAYEVTEFLCFRRNKKGEHQQLKVTIMDSHEEECRYTVSATREDGKGASGNASSSLQEAIGLVHWYKLDE